MLHTNIRNGAIVGDLINLKKFSKQKKREQSANDAELNRVRFGRTKSERALAKHQANRAEILLNQHHMDGEQKP